MSERMTSVRLRNPKNHGVFGGGVSDYGRRGRAEMIAQLRSYAEAEKRVVDEILAAADEDFIVETYLGVIVQRDRTEVEA